MKNSLIVLAIILFVSAGCSFSSKLNPTQKNSTNTQNGTASNKNETTTPDPEAIKPNIQSPISDAQNRVSKKFFGTYVTPENSPVSPERFSGFHTGLDFETFPEEKDTDVAVSTICSGKILRKNHATGYGGVLVQGCNINNQTVTVVYGHLKLSSIKQNVGDTMNTGESFALLGKGFSTETDNERKHLHLSIHLGENQNIKGYVQSKTELSGWLDPKELLSLE